jgi:hypothetical protein
MSGENGPATEYLQFNKASAADSEVELEAVVMLDMTHEK